MDLLWILGIALAIMVVMFFCCADVERAKFDFEKPRLNLDD